MEEMTPQQIKEKEEELLALLQRPSQLSIAINKLFFEEFQEKEKEKERQK